MQFAVAILLAAVFQGAETTSSESGSRIGLTISDFKLQDYLGTWHTLDEFSQKPILVVAFVGTDCPLARAYGARLAELAKQYSPQNVAFLGIDSNQLDSPTEIGHFARRSNIEFPILKDPGNVVADRFRASRTPEVYVLDKDRVVRYWGKIDDQFGIGYSLNEPKQKFLAEALDQLLAGRAVQRPEVPSAGCLIGRVMRETPKGDITYSQHVSRVVQQRCVQCHRSGGIAPFSLTEYEDVAGWAETIREVLQEGRMPPWHANPHYGHFANQSQMTAAEKTAILEWIENGVPEGNPAELPTPVAYEEGWSIGRPDHVVLMPQPFQIPATGVLSYQYFVVDPGFLQDTWIKTTEAVPGNRSVVHHIVVFIQPPGTEFRADRAGIEFEMLGVYVPGTPPLELPEGVARLIPAGAKLVFQMHYTPNGSPQEDQSRLGLVFADPAKVRKTVQMGATVNPDLRIPPRAANHRIAAMSRISHDMFIHSLTPHMHLRGKSFRFEALYPNGRREILLDVPHYDFNWQHTYRLLEPKLLPAGTLVKCIAHYDNSENNLANPDPNIQVTWGDQSWEEMMIGYYEGFFAMQDLSLPRPEIKQLGGDEYEVHFTYCPDRPAKTVHLAGTFNKWSNDQHPMQLSQDGKSYSTRLRLKQGTYRYKFVVDRDLWIPDPASHHLVGVLHEAVLVVGQPQHAAE